MQRICILLSVLLLCACENDVPPAPPQAIHFTSPPYALKVASINVIEDYVPTRNSSPSVAPPDKAMKDWARSRLVAAGNQGRLEVDIVDASIIRKDLPKQKTGIEGWLTKEQTEQYDGTLDVTLKIYDDRKILPVAQAHVSAHETLTLSEDSSLEDKKALYRQMTFDLMQQIDGELDKNIKQYFAHYLL